MIFHLYNFTIKIYNQLKNLMWESSNSFKEENHYLMKGFCWYFGASSSLQNYIIFFKCLQPIFFFKFHKYLYIMAFKFGDLKRFFLNFKFLV